MTVNAAYLAPSLVRSRRVPLTVGVVTTIVPVVVVRATSIGTALSASGVVITTETGRISCHRSRRQSLRLGREFQLMLNELLMDLG